MCLCLEWVAKLADFGASRHTGNAAGSDVMTMTMAGTPVYCAPEVLQGDPYNKSADVYSFGLVLLEMLIGNPLYVKVELQKTRSPYSATIGWRPTIPDGLRDKHPALVELIECCWNADLPERLVWCSSRHVLCMAHGGRLLVCLVG